MTVPPMLFWERYEAGCGGMKGCGGKIECGGMKGFGGSDGGCSRARMICMLLRWSLQQKTPYLADKVISEEAVDTDAVRAEDRHREGEPVQQVARRTKPTAKHTRRPTPPGLIRGNRLVAVPVVVHMVRVYQTMVYEYILWSSLLQQACAFPIGT